MREVPVVGHDDAAHGIEDHLEHGLGSEGGGDDIGDSLNGKERAIEEDWVFWKGATLAARMFAI